MIKSKTTDMVRNKDKTAHINEMLLKVYAIIYVC